MPVNNKHMTVDGTIEVLNDLQSKADGRFAQGGGLVFSVDSEYALSATQNGHDIDFPGGNDGPESVTGVYTISAENWNNGVYSLEDTYPSSKWNISISPCTTTTAEQLAAYTAAQMVGAVNANTLTCLGTVPAIDIVVMIDAISKKKQNVALVTLSAENWDDGVYSLESAYPSNQFNVIVSPCSTTTAEQLEAYNTAQIVGDANLNKLTALGTAPEIDIVVMVTAFGKTVSNAKWVSYERTLTASGWTNSEQTISVPGVIASTVGTIGISSTATAEQKTAATKVHLTAQSTDSLTFTCEAVPDVDIPIVINIQE